MLNDLRFALRQLRKSPGFTLTAVLTLALGIGANTAIYSIIHGALRLPYPHADRMVAIENVYPQGSYFSVSYPDFIAWRAQNRSFAALTARFTNRMTWLPAGMAKGAPQVVNVGLVSEGYFRMFGMAPVAGRGFLASEHVKGAPRVCVLSQQFWKTEFGGTAGAIGSTIILNGRACTVVGVVPDVKPNGSYPAQVWMTLEPAPPYDQHGLNYLTAVGLLRPGVTEQQALAELSGIQTQIDRQFPDNKHGIGLEMLSRYYFGDLRALMLVLLAAVGFILLIACVNLANMLLARAADRSREFALRRALGASPGRMLRQTLTESVLLGVAGAVAGLAVAVAMMHIPIAAWPKGMVAPSDVRLDGAVLAFTSLLGVATGVLFGMVPALRILRQDDRAALQPGRTMTESREHGRVRSALVVAEIALSMLLVAGALNMALYFMGLLRVNVGANPQNAMAMTVQLSPAGYAQAPEQRRFFDALLDKLAALPEVRAVGGSLDTPFTGSISNGDFQYEGQPTGTADRNPFAEKHVVTPGYFAALGTRVLEGRDFNRQDGPGAQPVVILNQSMARKLWPGQDPIGKYIQEDKSREVVVGIVGDVRFNGPAEPSGFQIYRSMAQETPPVLTFVLRTAAGVNPMSAAGAARHAVAEIDPEQAVLNVASLDSLAEEAVAGQRTSTMVTAILGCLALLLASIGVYGVMAYSVSRREREFSIRIALGADRGSIARLLVAGASRLTLLGVAIGGLLAWTAKAWIESRLGATGHAGLAMGLAAVLLSAVAAAATAVPARRATSADPMEALRSE